MRLPTDTVLLVGKGADPELERVWQEEALPIRTLAGTPAEAELEALETATLVVCGQGAAEAAAQAGRLGFRTFLVGEGPCEEGVRAVTVAEALAGARNARARERWKAARA